MKQNPDLYLVQGKLTAQGTTHCTRQAKNYFGFSELPSWNLCRMDRKETGITGCTIFRPHSWLPGGASACSLFILLCKLEITFLLPCQQFSHLQMIWGFTASQFGVGPLQVTWAFVLNQEAVGSVSCSGRLLNLRTFTASTTLFIK